LRLSNASPDRDETRAEIVDSETGIDFCSVENGDRPKSPSLGQFLCIHHI